MLNYATECLKHNTSRNFENKLNRGLASYQIFSTSFSSEPCSCYLKIKDDEKLLFCTDQSNIGGSLYFRKWYFKKIIEQKNIGKFCFLKVWIILCNYKNYKNDFSILTFFNMFLFVLILYFWAIRRIIRCKNR